MQDPGSRIPDPGFKIQDPADESGSSEATVISNPDLDRNHAVLCICVQVGGGVKKEGV